MAQYTMASFDPTTGALKDQIKVPAAQVPGLGPLATATDMSAARQSLATVVSVTAGVASPSAMQIAVVTDASVTPGGMIGVQVAP